MNNKMIVSRRRKSRLVSTAALLLFFLAMGAALAAGAEASGEEAARLAANFDQGALIAFAGVFLIGLALNLTPCVYPMLTITVSIFGARSETRPLLVFGRALVYVLGIATMYSVLGVVAALTGGLFGGILQSRAVLAGIGLLFILLALSMFGVYELQPPLKLMNRLGGRRTAGLLGTYLSGLFVGIFAAPCIGPPIIGLLALVGQRGDPLFGFAAFFILSLGLGFPYLLLGTFSGLLNRLPKSGEWMIWVKKLLGIGLVGVGLFYLALAYNPALVFILIPASLAAGGIYLGFLERSRGRSRYFPWIKRAAGIIALIAAAVIYRSGRLPSLEWEPYGAKRLAATRKPGGTAMLYFSANWCIPCLELDRRTFTDGRVIEKLEQLPHFKVNLTSYDSPESREVRERYEIAGVPTIVFIDGRGNEIRRERIVGFVRAEELLESVERATRAAASPAVEAAARMPTAAAEAPSRALLISDVEWIQPGRPFRAGILFTMRDQWHVYWLNPGDSGIEPRMNWTLPGGFTMGEPRWPAPRRFDDPPFATFGLEEEMLVEREIRPPDDLRPGETVTLAASVSWQVCKEICILLDDRVELTLPVRDTPPKTAERWAAAFQRAEAAVPVSDPGWRFSARMDRTSITLDLLPPEGIPEKIVREAQFFPAQIGILRTDSQTWIRSGEGFRLRMIRDRIHPDQRLRGVLALPKAAGEYPRAIAVDVELQGA